MRQTTIRKTRTHNKLSVLAFVVLLFVSLGGIVLWRMPTIQVMSVQSNSMAPAIRRGDAVVFSQARKQDLKVGDIVSYRSPANQAVIITHRVVAVESNWGLLVTKGDNATRADKPIAANDVLGKVTTRIAYAGFALDFLRSPAGLIAAVYVPAGIIVLLELRRLVTYYAKPTYRLIGY
jgi:signal peptidase